MTAHDSVPSRRSVIAGALGMGALGSVAMAPGAEALDEPSIPTAPGTKFYLLLATIPGSVTVPAFANQIEVLTWSWGASNPTDPLAATGGGSGKSTPGDVIFVAHTDIQSPKLVNTLNKGLTLPSAQISCVKPGSTPYTFLTLKFETVVVANYFVTPDATNAAPLDVVHLKFVKVTHKFQPQKQDGSPGTVYSSSFDYKTRA